MHLVQVGGTTPGRGGPGGVVPLSGGQVDRRVDRRRRGPPSSTRSPPTLPGPHRPLACIPPSFVSVGGQSLSERTKRKSQEGRGVPETAVSCLGGRGRGTGGVSHSPGPALPVRALPGAAAVPDVVAIDGDQLLPALGRLLLLPEPVVLPATFVLPQLPVSVFGPDNTKQRQPGSGLGGACFNTDARTREGGAPLLLLGVPPDIVFEEQALPRDVGRVLSVLVIVQLLSSFSSGLRLWVVGGFLSETGSSRSLWCSESWLQMSRL